MSTSSYGSLDTRATRLVNEGFLGIPPAMCQRCGLIGKHADSVQCITALRDRIARLEFKLSSREGR